MQLAGGVQGRDALDNLAHDLADQGRVGSGALAREALAPGWPRESCQRVMAGSRLSERVDERAGRDHWLGCRRWSVNPNRPPTSPFISKTGGKAVRAEVVEQYRTAEQLHGEEPVFGAAGKELVQRDQVRVRDAGDAAEFLFEEVERGGADAAQGLERDGDAAVPVEGFVNYSHAAFADLANQIEAVRSFELWQAGRHGPVLTSGSRLRQIVQFLRGRNRADGLQCDLHGKSHS